MFVDINLIAYERVCCRAVTLNCKEYEKILELKILLCACVRPFHNRKVVSKYKRKNNRLNFETPQLHEHLLKMLLFGPNWNAGRY